MTASAESFHLVAPRTDIESTVMTLVVPEGHATVVHQFGLATDAEPMVNTYGIRLEDGAAFTAQALAAALHDAYADFFCAQEDSDWTVQSTTVNVKIGPGPNDFTTGLDATARPGTMSATNTCPVNTAYLIHKRTAVSGRSGRGRLYLPGVPEALVADNGVLTAGTATSLNTALATWLDALNGLAAVEGMVVLHDSNSAASADPPPIVTLLQCDLKVATQRRRLRR